MLRGAYSNEVASCRSGHQTPTDTEARLSHIRCYGYESTVSLYSALNTLSRLFLFRRLLLDDAWEGVIRAPIGLQLPQLLNRLVKRNRLAAILRRRVVAVAHIDLPVVPLFSSDNWTREKSVAITSINLIRHSGRTPTKDEVILRDLGIPDLLRQRVARGINVGPHLVLFEDLLHLERVVQEAHTNRDNHDLPRAQPVRPLAGEVLDQNTCGNRQSKLLYQRETRTNHLPINRSIDPAIAR